MSPLEQFLSELEELLPEICTDKDLIDLLPDIFKNPSALHRMRARGQTPEYFFIAPYFYYLRGNIISWLRSRHQCNDTTHPQVNEEAIACQSV